MLLPADREFALEPMRRLADRGGRVAAPEGIIILHPRAGDERVCNRDGRRLGLDIDPGEPRRPAGLVAGAGDDGEQRLTVEHHFLVGKKRLVGEYRRDVIPARDICGRQNRDDAGGRAD